MIYNIHIMARGATVVAGTLLALMGGGCGAHIARTTPMLPAPQTPRRSADTATTTPAAQNALVTTASAKLSPASELLVNACNNYLSLNPENQKSADVLTIKASLYYNNRLFSASRQTYRQLLQKFPSTPNAVEAVRMIAQGFYEEKLFDSAQVWYVKLSTLSGDGVNKSEAVERIAESMFRKAEQYESQQLFKEAAEQYQRIFMEFPAAKIADVALFNAGLCYEKLTEWSHMILTFEQLLQRYAASPLIPKAMFRIGKANEKLMKWEQAAGAYLRMVARFPTSDLAPTALYNAGFCFENANKLTEAAATFEKMVQLYPSSEDAADILFRAGEIYGKLKSWEAVTRVNQLFAQRFGNDADRAIQALCMVGVALYMQNKEDAAIGELKGAVAAFSRIKNPSASNGYYAAKAQFTIGEIEHTRMKAVALTLPKSLYQKQLGEKSRILDRAVEAYSLVIKFSISEWTTRAIGQIGQAYEDFAVGIFKQERPADLGVADRLSLELGIAQAVEKYFVEKALRYHEQNVKLGIKEKLEDKNILASHQKLTYLPYLAGENYLALAEIAKTAEGTQKADGFALIARKLELLQKIAPFQERAVGLFLKCLEMGTAYQETDEFYRKASARITSTSCTVAQTYADVVSIVLEAPIPPNFDDYERFIYKTKLLKQVEGYENQAMTGYLKTLKIAGAYAIDDESVRQARERLAQLLFTSGRCKDLLCLQAFASPPFPRDISEAEKEEYRARFEEIGLRFQEDAFETYKSALKFAEQRYTAGPFVTHAYVRLYQNFPNDYGVPEERGIDSAIWSGPEWKCTGDSAPGWTSLDYSDSGWSAAQTAKGVPDAVTGFPVKTPTALATAAGAQVSFFRRTFTLNDTPRAARFYCFGTGTPVIFINNHLLAADSGAALGQVAMWDLVGKLRFGKNVLAIRMGAAGQGALYPLIEFTVPTRLYVPRPPGADKPLTAEQVRPDVYQFPFIKNFSPETNAGKQ
jgi:TolA-binding protein